MRCPLSAGFVEQVGGLDIGVGGIEGGEGFGIGGDGGGTAFGTGDTEAGVAEFLAHGIHGGGEAFDDFGVLCGEVGGFSGVIC